MTTRYLSIAFILFAILLGTIVFSETGYNMVKINATHQKTNDEKNTSIFVKQVLYSITDNSFEVEILRSSTPALILFWAEWCEPCKTIMLALREIADSMSGQVKLTQMDIDENTSTPSRYGVRGIPTLLIFKDGELIDRKIGAASKENIESWIRSRI